MKNLDLQIFPDVDKSTWHTLAEKQLKGQDPKQALAWENLAGIALDPYYDESDLEEISYLQDFFSNTKPFHWKLYEEIHVEDEIKSGREAVDALVGGCNGIILNIKNQVDLSVVLKEVDVNICDIFVMDKDELLPKDSASENLIHLNSSARSTSGHPIEDVVMLIKSLASSGFVFREALPDFFLEIAMIRAIRFLLHDHLDKDAFSIHIHTAVPLHGSADQQWFLNSTAGLASILGGTSSLSLSTAEGSSRISRNVGNLIREESGIDVYSDQCGGSYYVETLTHKIIQACKEQLS